MSDDQVKLEPDFLRGVGTGLQATGHGMRTPPDFATASSFAPTPLAGSSELAGAMHETSTAVDAWVKKAANTVTWIGGTVNAVADQVHSLDGQSAQAIQRVIDGAAARVPGN